MSGPVTTSATLRRDLRDSLNYRTQGVPTGNTWGAFKAAMTILGVQDEDRLASIEFGCAQDGSGRIVRDDAGDGIEIRETV